MRVRKSILVLCNFFLAITLAWGRGGGQNSVSSSRNSSFNTSYSKFQTSSESWYKMFIGLILVILIKIIFYYLPPIAIKEHFLLKKLKRLPTQKAKEVVNELKEISEQHFHLIQQYWQAQNIPSDAAMTPLLREKYSERLNTMFHLRQKNYISNIQIEDIRITKLLLNSDGAPATFVALIEGSMVDYLVNESSGLILKNEDKTILPFRDLYYFEKNQGIWQLARIINSPNPLRIYLL